MGVIVHGQGEIAPAHWADVDGVRAATAGRGIQGRTVAPSVRWTSPPKIKVRFLGEN